SLRRAFSSCGDRIQSPCRLAPHTSNSTYCEVRRSVPRRVQSASRQFVILRKSATRAGSRSSHRISRVPRNVVTVAEWQPQQIRPARQILSAHLAQEVFSDYVQYLCPMDQAGAEGVVCKTIPNTSS